MTAQQRKKPVSKKPAKNAAKSSASKAKNGTKRGSTAASRDAVGTVLANHRADVWGVGALLFGLLTAFAVWLGSAGFIGDVLDDGLALGVGLTRAIVPLALIGVGGLLIMGGDVDESDVERTARVTIGGLLTLVSATGLLHVLRGGLVSTTRSKEVGAAGGALGMAVGGPLHALADGAGAVVILLAIGVIGVIIVTGSSARAVGRLVGRVSPRSRIWCVVRSTICSPTQPRASTCVLSTPERLNRCPNLRQNRTRSPRSNPNRHRKSTKRKKAEPVAEAEQQQLPTPKSVGNWKLPPASLLSRSQKQEIDKAMVAERGRLLHYTLDQFGVDNPTRPGRGSHGHPVRARTR